MVSCDDKKQLAHASFFIIAVFSSLTKPSKVISLFDISLFLLPPFTFIILNHTVVPLWS